MCFYNQISLDICSGCSELLRRSRRKSWSDFKHFLWSYWEEKSLEDEIGQIPQAIRAVYSRLFKFEPFVHLELESDIYRKKCLFKCLFY